MFGSRPVAPTYVPFSKDQKDMVQQAISSQTVQLEHIGKQRTKEIKPGTELRLTISPEDDVYLKAHSRIPDTFATAEIFGMELVMGHEYKIQRGTSVAIFSWHGCTIEMRGPTTMEYDASNHVMKDYVNLAGILEQKRQRAEELGSLPPHVLILGSAYSGKSTLALFLSNYALRKHRRPIYVELDPGSLSAHRQLPSIPGVVSALHTDHSAYELNQEPVHPQRTALHKGMDQGVAAAHLNPNYPVGKSINFWYGFEDWSAAPGVYWKCLAQLSCLVAAKQELNEAKAAAEPGVVVDGEKLENPAKGGLIINGPRDASPAVIDEIVRLFRVNVVVVIEDEANYKHCIDKYCGGVIPTVPKAGGESASVSGRSALIMLDAMDGEADDDGDASQIDVVHLAKAGAVIPANTEEDRNRLFHTKLADLFHGPERDLICHNFIVPLRELFVSQIVQVPQGEVNMTNGPKWRSRFTVKPFAESASRLRHSILAVVLAPSNEDVVISTIAGFVWVREVTDPDDPVNATLHIMCPSTGPLVSPYLLHGDLDKLKYFE